MVVFSIELSSMILNQTKYYETRLKSDIKTMPKQVEAKCVVKRDAT